MLVLLCNKLYLLPFIPYLSTWSIIKWFLKHIEIKTVFKLVNHREPLSPISERLLSLSSVSVEQFSNHNTGTSNNFIVQ